MLGFLIAAAAGFLTPQIESAVAKPLMSALEKHIPVTPSETSAIAFMVALLGAAVLGALVDSGSVFGVITGAILGYFGLRIFNLAKTEIERRTGD
jgi:ABC-type microcin C transport system permease subunit YejE